jgi:uncharacterized protein (TIGR03083 family)
MNATTTRVTDIPALEHDEAMQMARVQTTRFLELLRSLDDADWTKPTDCTRWTVKDIVAHMIGIAEAMANPAERDRQQAAGAAIAEAEGLNPFDAWTESQVQERAHLSGPEILAAYEEAAPRLQAARENLPLEMRDFLVEGTLTLGHLYDIVLTRDVWMHGVDIARATGRDVTVTADHDGRFVANVVAELASQREEPFTATLTGPAGGTYVHGEGGEAFELDAVEFARILSGRGDASHPLHNAVLF